MKKWLRGSRGMLALVAMWTVGWGLGFGGFMELAVDQHGEIEDIWFTVLAFPGFIGGVLFAVAMRFAAGPRSLDEVPFGDFVTWGVVTGLVLGMVGVAIGLAGEPLSLEAAALVGAASGLGLLSAIGSAVFFLLLTRGPAAEGRTG